MSTYAPLVIGTPLVWTSSGGDYVLDFTSRANGYIRQGGKSTTSLVDGTKGLPALLEIVLETNNLGAAPTNGLTLDLYLASSASVTAATKNPGSLTGVDGVLSYTSVLPMLAYVGSLVLSNDIGTGLQRQDAFIFVPKDIAIIPVLVNNSGQTTSGTGTDTKITVTPWYQQSS